LERRTVGGKILCRDEGDRRASVTRPDAQRGRAGVRPYDIQAPPPAPRPGIVLRSPLIARLAAERSSLIVSVVAPSGTLVAEAEALRARIAAERGPSSSGASSLTAAELRILPMLATHLSYPEIAAELFVSPTTIKSQAYSIFRKLGAPSRSEAVIRSRQLELLDGEAPRRRRRSGAIPGR
jgi:LuxR family transcriptional regulator, maltose regulon positive regulatory protein